MSVEMTVKCDECRDIYEAGDTLSVAEARAAAKEEGWERNEEGDDLCPDCVEAIAEEEEDGELE